MIDNAVADLQRQAGDPAGLQGDPPLDGDGGTGQNPVGVGCCLGGGIPLGQAGAPKGRVVL